MDPVQALILKLMESRAGQDRAALNPSSPQPGQAQAGPVGTGPEMPTEMGTGMNPDDLIAQMLQGQMSGPPQR